MKSENVCSEIARCDSMNEEYKQWFFAVNVWTIVKDIDHHLNNNKNEYLFDWYFPIWFGTIIQISG